MFIETRHTIKQLYILYSTHIHMYEKAIDIVNCAGWKVQKLLLKDKPGVKASNCCTYTNKRILIQFYDCSYVIIYVR